MSKPEMEFHMINVTYVALHMHAETEKTTFSCKDDCTLTKHTRRWTYSALRYFFFGMINILNQLCEYKLSNYGRGGEERGQKDNN